MAEAEELQDEEGNNQAAHFLTTGLSEWQVNWLYLAN
jgi:hypothetical protein